MWSDTRSYAKKIAASNGRIKSTKTGGGCASSSSGDEAPVGDEAEYAYTSDSVDVDRVMAIIGWACAFGSGVPDELSVSTILLFLCIYTVYMGYIYLACLFFCRVTLMMTRKISTREKLLLMFFLLLCLDSVRHCHQRTLH